MARKYVEFSEVVGKRIKNLTLFTSSDFHAIAVRFQDATVLSIELEPSFTARADYSDWTTGDRRLIRKWPPLASETHAVTPTRKPGR
jgi:hypothetical protein